MSRRAARRSRRSKAKQAPAPIAAGAPKGTPRFLSRRNAEPGHARRDGAAEREARAAAVTGDAVTERPVTTALGQAGAAAVRGSSSVGRPLEGETRGRMEQRFGMPFKDVRIHEDSPVAKGFGANAVTHGGEIHFGTGRYDPDTAAGDQLLGHELAHVVQQRGGGPPVAQFDIPGQSLESAMGVFEIEMQNATSPSGEVGLRGDIAFNPDPEGPYSTRIGLLQTVSTSKLQSSTLDPAQQSGEPDPWAGTPEADRDVIATTGQGAVDPGWFVDTLTARFTPSDQVEPYYLVPYGEGAGNQYGHLRSPSDVKPASLWDFPGSTYDQDFDFETAAVGADNQVVYGVLHWGFEVAAGAVQREYVFAEGAQSVEFEEARERFRGFYAHEPVVIYFDTDAAVPIAGEAAKLADLPQYMTDYPDAVIDLEGYADERGSDDYNSDLASRRADAVRALLEASGIAAARIDDLVPVNETTEFGAGGAARRTPGNLRANRRVMIRFRRQASTPPVGP